MKTAIRMLLVLVVATAAVGCKKAKPDVKPTEQTESKAELSEPSEWKKAEGPARDALLALQRVHFEFDSFNLTEDSRSALTEAAGNLKQLSGIELFVDGHADETGETEYNLQLGEKRATAVRDFLTRQGVDGEILHVVSFGEEKPLSGSLAENRRVDFRLMEGNIELVVEQGAPKTRPSEESVEEGGDVADESGETPEAAE